MKKVFSVILAIIILACAFAGCSKPESKEAENASAESTSVSATEATEPAIPLGEDKYHLDVNITIEAPVGYNTYGKSSGYTEEMCKAQGVTYENMSKYLDMTDDGFIMVPENEPFADAAFEIRAKLKNSKDYGIINLNDLNEDELKYAADTLVAGFTGAEGYEIVKTDKATFIVFDWKTVKNTRRYATVIDGCMIYIYGETNAGPLTEENKSYLDAVAKSIDY